MIRNKKKGFTLVELLAVIVILAIILVIAVPQIMSTIKDTTKASLESSAKMVAAQVEKQYTVAQTLGKEFGDTGSCMEDWAGLNKTDYESCSYEITDNGTAKITLIGKGKFKNLSVCSGTRSNATATEDKCPLICKENEIAVVDSVTATTPYEIKDYDSCVSYLSNELPNYGVEQTIIEEVIPTLCKGEPVFEMNFSQNIEEFINVGFTELELIENNVIKGTIEKRCIVAENAITKIQNLLKQESTLNNGLKHITTTYTDWEDVTHSLDAGIRYVGENPNNYVEFNNEVWRIIGLVDVKTSSGSIEKRVKIIKDEPLISSWLGKQQEEMFGEDRDYNISKVLNEYYLNNSNSCEYYSEGIKNCSEIITPINSKYLNLIEEVSLNIGYGAGMSKDNSSPAASYYYELNESFRSWTGKVGLIYPSDYGFASNDVNCANSMSSQLNSTCPNDNWLHSNDDYWTLSENKDDSDMVNILYVNSLGISDDRYGSKNIRPVVYLKPNVKISGNGTNDSNIFRLGM